MESFTTLTDLATELGTTPEDLHAAAAGHMFDELAPHGVYGGYTARLDRNDLAMLTPDRILVHRVDADCISAADVTRGRAPKHRRHVLTAYSLEPLEAVTDEYLAAVAARSAFGRGAEDDL